MIQMQNKLFTLQTTNTTYQMKVDQYDVLLHTYYGSRIDDSDLSYTIQSVDRGFSGNPYGVVERSYSLDTIPQEYTTFGTGDYRSSCLQVMNSDGSHDCELRYVKHEVYQGKKTLEGMPSIYGTEQEVETLEVTLKDEISNVEVILSYSVFETLDIIARSVKVINGADKQLKLQKVLSCCVDFHIANDFDMISFYGRHSYERAVERTPVRHGKLVVDSVRGASSHHQNPFVILCDHQATETTGNCYGFSFVYSGNFIAQTEVDQANQTRFVMGIHPTAFEFLLEPGDSFTTPEVVMSYSEHGLGQLSRNYHKVYRHHLCRGKYKTARRPILINNWEATYFDFDDKKLVKIAEDAAKLGIEMLVMDDGWFGNRFDDNRALGDWFVNEEKLKGGLSSLCERVNALGMKLGIWFEPEMISEDSDLYRAHPDWVLRTNGRKGTLSRNQFVLDMSRKDVEDYLFEAISKILDSANIEYVKWDMNRHLSNVWSAKLPPERQGEVYHRYVLGLYSLLERLTTKYEDVLFEGCSGGGGRFDPAMLAYSPQIWCSDNTDAIDRINIQYGTSFGYPISAVGSHVSACPNHQTRRSTPLHTRGVVAMSGTFGYELDINQMTEEEKEIVKEQTTTFKRYYDLISDGDYYRLTNPFDNHYYAAWEFVAQDQSKALLNFVLLKPQSNPQIINIKLQGLDKEAKYCINDQTYSGQALMKAGFSVPVMYGDYTAAQFEIVKIS